MKSNHTEQPTFRNAHVYKDYPGATLTAHAFDRTIPGLGTWLVLIAAWLFAISTMISWAYYGEQGMVYMLGSWSVAPYKILYVMLWANIPIMLIFSFVAMKAYRSYISRLKKGEFKSHKSRGLTEMAEE